MTFSPSRIGTWMACEVKGGFEYICGYKDPGNEDTDLGKRVHGYLEWLKSTPGALPDRTTEVGAIAAEALPHVEDFSLADGAQIEGHFTLQGRHAWQGYKDLRKSGKIVDYKTTTPDFKWAKTHDDLMFDPQAVMYAHHELTVNSPAAPYIEDRKSVV